MIIKGNYMKKLSIFSASLIAIAAILIAPAAYAAEFIAPSDEQGNVSIPASETHRNLYVGGGSVSIASPTTGDLFVAGGNVLVEGNIEQDLFIAGGNVTVNGTVGGDIRAAGGNVLINNTVGGDVLVAGGSVRISEKSTIAGDLVSGTGEIIVDGAVVGNVKAGGGMITLNSKIDGAVEVYADESLTFGSRAVIPATVSYHGVTEAVRQDGAQVGEVNFQKVERAEPSAGKAIASIFTVMFFIKILGLIIAGLILMKLFPQTARNAVMLTQQSPWINLGIGALFLVVVPILAFIILVTFVGFYVAMIAFLAYGLLLIIGTLVSMVFAGSLIFKLTTKTTVWRVDWQSLVLGTVVVAILMLIPVLGWLLFLVILLMSFGALLRMLYGHIRQEQSRAVISSPII